MADKIVHIQYYALLREERGLSQETLSTQAATARELYEELRARHRFKLSRDLLKAAVNDEFVPWNQPLSSGDRVIFIPPVAGG